MRRFILSHRLAIEKASLQAYASALIFSPVRSLIRQLFQSEEPTWLVGKSTKEEDWDACVATLEGHSNSVTSAAFSADGQQVVSASEDRTVKLWNAATSVCLDTISADADEITDVLIDAFPANREWWDYRFPYREQYPEEHRRYIGLLVQAWISAENQDYVVMVAELLDRAMSEKGRIGAFVTWNIAYVNKRKHGPGYVEVDPLKAVRDAGGANRRDAKPSQTAAFAAGMCVVEKTFHDLYGDDHLVLQALGTRTDCQRKGLGSALVRWGLEKAAEDEVATTVVSSPMGRFLYHCLMFEDVGDEVVCQAPSETKRMSLYAMAFDPKKQKLSGV